MLTHGCGSLLSMMEPETFQTSLHVAAFCGRDAILRFLLDTMKMLEQRHMLFLGGGSSTAATAERVSQIDHRGWSPLHVAAFYGHLGCARILVEADASIDTQTNDGNLSLHYHAAGSPPRVENDTRLNICPQLIDGSSIAYSKEEVRDMITMLSSSGELVNRVNYKLETPLHYACHSMHPTAWHVQRLLELGANPNVFSRRGHTPLQLAIHRGKKDVVAALLLHGADVSVKSSIGSCLDLAKGHPEILNMVKGKME